LLPRPRKNKEDTNFQYQEWKRKNISIEPADIKKIIRKFELYVQKSNNLSEIGKYIEKYKQPTITEMNYI
jgi:endonuclease III